MDPFCDLEEDGTEVPLIWQSAISGESGIVVPIGVCMKICPSNRSFVHTHFLYMTAPNFIEVILGRPGISVATRYHQSLN